MAKVKYKAYWDHNKQKELDLKGYVLYKVDDSDLERLQKAYKKLLDNQVKYGKLRELQITTEIFYQKRTLDMNALSWSLYSIESQEMNAGLTGHKDQNITPEQLYEDDVKTYAKQAIIELDYEIAVMIAKDYSFHRIEKLEDNRVRLTLWKSNSHMDTKEFGEWIERQFNRLSYIGIHLENGAAVEQYWKEFKQHMNDKKIILIDSKLTQAEYKNLTPICEATGKFIGHGGGSLAHINPRGMGGRKEPYRNYTSNWLHLSDMAHMEWDNGSGKIKFLKKYPWLKYKIEVAMKKEYTFENEDFQEEIPIF